MSTNRSSYVPFTKSQQDGVARKDIVTFYDASGVPKVSKTFFSLTVVFFYSSSLQCKGFGPKNPPPTEPVQGVRKDLVFDKIVFRSPIRGRLVYIPQKRVPHR